MTKDCSLNYEFSTWKFQAQNIWAWNFVENMLCTQIVCLFFILTFWTIFVHNMFSTCSKLGIFIYWTRNSVNNVSSYCGLFDARISASDKKLPLTDYYAHLLFCFKPGQSSKFRFRPILHCKYFLIFLTKKQKNQSGWLK